MNSREIGVHEFNLSEYGRLKTVGVTDQFTSCCCCGKQNLKKTVVMKDSEGNYSFFGSSCAHAATRQILTPERKRKIHIQFWDDHIAPTLK